ncbi:cytochrome c oxidase subunit 2A [Virgibacillus sp. DJP39]
MGLNKTKQVDKEENSFRGTLLSVGFVAAVIVIMWVGVFSLYMSRI